MGSGEGEEKGGKMGPERGSWRGSWEVTDCGSVRDPGRDVQCAVWGKGKLREALEQGDSLNVSWGSISLRARWLGEGVCC